jgi:hypothetical protein
MIGGALSKRVNVSKPTRRKKIKGGNSSRAPNK